MPDPYFSVVALSSTPNPQQLVWQAMHQDYSEGFIAESLQAGPPEAEAGERVVKHLLKGDRGHYGPLEHPQIVFNVGYFPHSVMQQLRTHRTISMDVQSGRYTGRRILEAANGTCHIEEVFYLRPLGDYTNRSGNRYTYTDAQRNADLEWCRMAAAHYHQLISEGISEEHARGLIPFDFRQHFVLSCNARSLMHILDLRSKADAQLEIQCLCEKLMDCFRDWMPAVAQWYEANRYGKARLAP